MKNRIEWNGIRIWRWFAVVDDNDNPVAEFFDENPKQAEHYAACFENYRVRLAAAEEINEDGDLNPAVYDDTLRGVMSKLKRALIG